MRFLDSCVFIHAVLDPGPKRLTERDLALKEKARTAMREIDGGERVATTVVHLSEIANFCSKQENLPRSHDHVGSLLTNPHVRVLDVTREDYERALEVARKRAVDVSDALAHIAMVEVLRTREVYTTNAKHFLALDPGVKVLPA